MKKFNDDRAQSKDLVLNRETIVKLEDEALDSVAGGCGGMRFTCTCTAN